MIYRAYSEPFFGGDYKVLRGGSWAVAPAAIRPSFRNWDHPIRRQIFTGRAAGLGRLRCAGTWPGSARRARSASCCWSPSTACSRQSYAPRRQAHGPMNADGWGVGFYAAGPGRARALAVQPAAVERRVVRLGRAR